MDTIDYGNPKSEIALVILRPIYELLSPKAGNRLFPGSALVPGRLGTGAREGSEGQNRSSDTVRLPDSVGRFSLQAEEQGEAEDAALGRGGSLSELRRREG